MNKFILILILNIVYHTMTIGQSAGGVPSVLKSRNAATSFEVEQLSIERQRAFEQKASEKVTDFIDLVNLLLEEGVDIEFKKYIHSMLLALFEREAAGIAFFLEKKDEAIPLKQFFKKINKIRGKSKLNIEELYQLLPTTAINDTSFKGAFVCVINYEKAATVVQEKYIFHYTIQKREKQFGANKKYIWRTLLQKVDRF